MTLKDHIADIQEGIRSNRFLNEASVSQGIVLRILRSLGWPDYDTRIVTPEYSVGGRRVDFALCHPPNKPLVFIEVKQIGQSEGADRQLFEYAFHTGIPMAIMTDGREWHFYLPGEQGRYEERRFYKLDLLERVISESAQRLIRYLLYDAIRSGEALESARKDYRNASRKRQAQDTIPIAWNKLLEEKDELLIELLADKVESLCGYKPSLDQISFFLDKYAKSINQSQITTTTVKKSKKHIRPKTKAISSKFPLYGFSFNGNFYECRNARDVLTQVIETLSKIDKSFLNKFIALPKHGQKRRYIAKTREELYPDRPDLCIKHSHRLSSGLWLGTNYSRKDIDKIIRLACKVAKVDFGNQLQISLGD
ncbi:hypothetical protein [Rhodocaloribacter sp.]